jgi:phytoene desaturase
MNDFDVIIIGAGAGGLCSGALLANAGNLRVLVLEKLPFVGGRFSSLVHKGFTLSTGAVSIEAKGPLEEIFNRLGLPFQIRYPEPQVKYLIKGKPVILPPKNGLEFLLHENCSGPGEVEKVLRGLKSASDALPRDISISSWMSRYTRDPGAFGVLHALCGGIFSVSLDDAPMAELVRMIRQRSFRRFGFPPGGNAALAQALAKYITEKGGAIITGAMATDWVIEDGFIRKVKWIREGKETESRCSFMISNMGVGNTHELAGPGVFSSQEKEIAGHMKASYTLTIEVFSTRPFIDFEGILMLPLAKRAAFITCPTLICPEWAPQGQHLTIVLGPPSKSEEPFNGKKEFDLLLDDARTYLPDFDKYATGWLTRSFRKNWPGFHARPGYSAPTGTSIPNLFHVGDSVNPPGLYGVGGCARSAMDVADRIQQQMKA